MQDYSLEELSQEVAAELGKRSLLGAAADHRISAAPDARTIRYYTGMGLLDRPLVQGRQARYGPRHLLQLLAIKALQSQGLALGQIQERLYGRGDAELQEVLDSIPPPRRVGAAAEGVRGSPGDDGRAIPVRRWREVPIEPGLKLMVEETWTPTLGPAARDERIHAVLSALEPRDDKGGRS